MGRRIRAWLTILVTLALVPVAGCVGGDSDQAPHRSPAAHPPAPLLRVEATLDVPGAGAVVTTHDRLWVISGGRAVVTQVDPVTDTVTQRTTIPHPVAYATVAHRSLWLVSYGESALIELDAESGRILRTLEGSPDLPLKDPVGVAVTGHDLWVLNHHNSTLLRIDERTGKLTQTTRIAGDAASGPYLLGHALWIGMSAQGIFHQVDLATGEVTGEPIHVPTGLCAWSSIVGHDIWATSMPFADFNCINGTSRIDTTSVR